MKYLFFVPALISSALLAASPLNAEDREADSGPPGTESAAAISGGDSVLARADSGLILLKGLSAGDYLARRETYFYPRTRRNDPFYFPIGKNAPSDILGPDISELVLTGVLYTPDGPRIAILSTKGGDSFLLREGDMLGLAELILIERDRIRFRHSEFGQVRQIVKELKPLAEEKNGQTPENAGSNPRQEEDQEEYDESGGPPPQRR